jgi:hypothetical protein
MRVCIFLAVVALLCFDATARADKKGPPTTHKVATADGKFVFVMIAPQPLEEELKHYGTDDAKNAVVAIRNVYKKSGLYKNDGSADPLWTIDWYSDATVLLPDGETLIRYGQPTLEQFRDKVDRKMREITANDLKQEALSVFAKGKLVREFKIADFVDDRKALKATVTMVLWAKTRKLNEEKKQLEIVTHDGNRVVIDLAAGKILEKKKAE